MPSCPPSSPPEFREEAVGLVQSIGKRVSEVAKHLGVGYATVRTWVRRHQTDAPPGRPAWSGSPSSLPAPTLLASSEPVSPSSTSASASPSLNGGGWARPSLRTPPRWRDSGPAGSSVAPASRPRRPPSGRTRTRRPERARRRCQPRRLWTGRISAGSPSIVTRPFWLDTRRGRTTSPSTAARPARRPLSGRWMAETQAFSSLCSLC